MEIEDIKNLTKDMIYISGCDEAGAGVLAGDLVVASVILDPEKPIFGLTDSKKLSEKKREIFYDQIVEKALDYSIIHIKPDEIDKINILQARMLGMKRSVEALKQVEYAIFDGNRVPDGIKVAHSGLVKGDLKHKAVSAASILAKVTRDRQIIKQSRIYKGYGFEKHKGYGTKVHLEALKRLGPCEIHRYSYKPVRDNIKSGNKENNVQY